MTTSNDTTHATSGDSLIGAFRRFGVYGPVYEVIGPASARPFDETLMRIRVIESGEEADYPLADILADPED